MNDENKVKLFSNGHDRQPKVLKNFTLCFCGTPNFNSAGIYIKGRIAKGKSGSTALIKNKPTFHHR